MRNGPVCTALVVLLFTLYEMIPAFFKISCTPASVLPATSSVQKSPSSRSLSGSTLQFGLWSALSHLKSSTWSHWFSCVSDHGGVFSVSSLQHRV